MTKQDVINRVSRRTKLDPAISRTVLESFFTAVKNSLVEGEPIYVRQFGSFSTKVRAQKVARNIKQNTNLLIPAHVFPVFKPSPEFVRQVREREGTLID